MPPDSLRAGTGVRSWSELSGENHCRVFRVRTGAPWTPRKSNRPKDFCNIRDPHALAQRHCKQLGWCVSKGTRRRMAFGCARTYTRMCISCLCVSKCEWGAPHVQQQLTSRVRTRRMSSRRFQKSEISLSRRTTRRHRGSGWESLTDHPWNEGLHEVKFGTNGK